MTSDEMFAEAAKRGLNLGRMCQYPYRLGSESRNDHWEVHFNDKKGNPVSGSGRTPQQALQSTLYPSTQKKAARPALRDDRDFSILD